MAEDSGGVGPSQSVAQDPQSAAQKGEPPGVSTYLAADETGKHRACKGQGASTDPFGPEAGDRGVRGVHEDRLSVPRVDQTTREG